MSSSSLPLPILALLAILSTVTVHVHAANDWSQPCFDGVCEYSLPGSSSSSSSSGSMKIWGSSNAISDVTSAAGWDIIDCQPDATVQDIRLVCTGSDADCGHLYQNDGPVDKIVRLPENCGANAFARVAKAWTPTDQSLPSRLAKFKRANSDTNSKPVRALALDTDFSAADVQKTGDVNFFLQGANIPGVNADLSGVNSESVSTGVDAGSVKRMRRMTRRGLLDSVIGTVSDALHNKFNVDKSVDLPADVDQTFNLFNQAVDCPPVAASLNVDVQAKAHAVATIGVVVSGTILPPKVNDFAVVADLNAELSGAIDMKADVSGTLDSGKKNLFSVGIPGLDFPGILKIGPTFDIDGQALAKLDVNVDLNVGVVYTITDASFVFPPGKDDSKDGGQFDIGDTPLKLSVSPSVKATGTVEAHLIPSINLGISAFADVVEAKVFLELDAKAALTLELEATALANATINSASASASASGLASASQSQSQSASAIASSIIASVTDVANASATDVASASAASVFASLTDVASASATDSAVESFVTDSAVPSESASAFASDSGFASESAFASDSFASASDFGLASDFASPTDSALDAFATESADVEPVDNAAADDSTSTDTGTDEVSAGAAEDPSVDDTADTDEDPVDEDDTDEAPSVEEEPSGSVDEDTTDDTTDSTDESTDDAETFTTDEDPSADEDTTDDTTASTDETTDDATDETTDDAETFPTDDAEEDTTDTTDDIDESGDDESFDDSSFDDSDTFDDSSFDDSSFDDSSFDDSSFDDSSFDDSSFDDSSDDSFFRRSSVASLIASARAADRRAKREITGDASASFGGCFTVSAALNVNIGASGSFFGLFDDSTTKNLFSKDFQIFQKCFGDRAAKRSLAPPVELTSLTARNVLDLLCPAPDAKTAQPVADESVSASSIQ